MNERNGLHYALTALIISLLVGALAMLASQPTFDQAHLAPTEAPAAGLQSLAELDGKAPARWHQWSAVSIRARRSISRWWRMACPTPLLPTRRRPPL